MAPKKKPEPPTTKPKGPKKVKTATVKPKPKKRKKGLSESEEVQKVIAAASRTNLESLVLNAFELAKTDPASLPNLFSVGSLASSLALPQGLVGGAVVKKAVNDRKTSFSIGRFACLPEVCVLEILHYLKVPDLLSISQTCENFLSLLKDPQLFSHGLLIVERVPSKTFPQLSAIFDFSKVKSLDLRHPADATLEEIKYFLHNFPDENAVESVSLCGKKFKSSVQLAALVGKLDFDKSKSNLTEIARVAGLVRQASVGGKYVKGTKPKLDGATLGERPTPTVKTLITKIEGTGGYGSLNMKALFEAFPAEIPELSQLVLDDCNYSPSRSFTGLQQTATNDRLVKLHLDRFNQQYYFSLINSDNNDYSANILTIATERFFENVAASCPNLEDLSLSCAQKSNYTWTKSDKGKYGAEPALWSRYIKGDHLKFPALRSLTLKGYSVTNATGFGSGIPSLEAFNFSVMFPKNSVGSLKAEEDIAKIGSLEAIVTENCPKMVKLDVEVKYFEDVLMCEPRVLYGFRYDWQDLTSHEMFQTDRFIECLE
ncbi:hypothetical protein TrLO_g3131 [Triparma laevis f. longispina]|uniref:F-box domain-containing protein n=1 Tax=Triparma laevis f. longispina TaxID=1714387 RepID=A0A9W7CBX0_9STRA|nr:hypothetical protein TrLO_g3131 [Triparma laevis f. longispina]